jgi:hypothetical protein
VGRAMYYISGRILMLLALKQVRFE